MTENIVENIIIVGGGCAGLTAAIYCARANLNPLVFTGGITNKGGLLAKTSIVENYPGFPDGILGYDLMNNMSEQAVKFGAEMNDNTILYVEKEGSIFKLSDGSNEYLAKSVIIATGSVPNKLGLPNEDLLWGKGLSSCAVCDGILYKNRKVAVVGGGDSACESALFLTKFTTVTMFLRGDHFRASEIMKNRVLTNPKIKVQYNTKVVQLVGQAKLEKIVIESGLNQTILDMDGLFYGLGLTPNNLFHNLNATESGHIIQFRSTTETSIPGIFSAGDISDEKYRQAVVACGEGCKAALEAIEYLATL